RPQPLPRPPRPSPIRRLQCLWRSLRDRRRRRQDSSLQSPQGRRLAPLRYLGRTWRRDSRASVASSDRLPESAGLPRWLRPLQALGRRPVRCPGPPLQRWLLSYPLRQARVRDAFQQGSLPLLLHQAQRGDTPHLPCPPRRRRQPLRLRERPAREPVRVHPHRRFCRRPQARARRRGQLQGRVRPQP
ncbi:hypothetical protein BN1708_018018, partial [Verticillium longisporum]